MINICNNRRFVVGLFALLSSVCALYAFEPVKAALITKLYPFEFLKHKPEDSGHLEDGRSDDRSYIRDLSFVNLTV